MKSCSIFKCQLPVAHVLMPLYNGENYIISSVQSVLSQSYSRIKLIIYNNGSTDNGLLLLNQFLEKNPKSKEVIHIINNPINKGVAIARKNLIQYSKKINSSAYLFWLDADDKYIKSDFIEKVLIQMKKTGAEICLYNFSVKFEENNEFQIKNAKGLMLEKKKSFEILKYISTLPSASAHPLEMPVLHFTSLGWTKCYSPTVDIPEPEDCAFEDFPPMAALLNVKTITALPATYEPLEYLRRTTSICGQRKAEHFTHDIPKQLECFFNRVFQDQKNKKEPSLRLIKLKLAQEFVLRKANQYHDTLIMLVQAKKHPHLDENTIKKYNEKVDELKLIMEKSIKSYDFENNQSRRCAL